MIQASAPSVGIVATTPIRSSLWRSRLILSVVGAYFLVALALPMLTGEAGFFLLRAGWHDVDQSWLYGCVILIAGWVALRPGRFFVRLAVGLIAWGWLFLAWLLGGAMAPNWESEPELTAVTSSLIAAGVLGVLLAGRRFTGKALAGNGESGIASGQHFRYSLAAMLTAVTLLCFTLALIGWIDHRYWNYTSSSYGQWRRFGWWLDLAVAGWGRSLCPLLVAAACLPAYFWKGKRAFAGSLVLSAAALVPVVLLDVHARQYVLFPLVQGKAVATWAVDYYLVLDVVNLATITLCLLTAAAAMHGLGYSLEAPARPTADE